MTARPKPPEGFDENPPLAAVFFVRSRPVGINKNEGVQAEKGNDKTGANLKE